MKSRSNTSVAGKRFGCHLVSVGLLSLLSLSANASFKYADVDTGLQFEMVAGLPEGPDQNRRALLIDCQGRSGDVVIPETVVYSHLDWKVVSVKSALNRDNVTSVVISDSVLRIAEAAFRSSPSLTNVVLGTGLKKIPDEAFAGCEQLQAVTLGAGVTSIGESSFEGCTNLTEIALPEGLTHIGKSAFKGCTSLARLIVPSTLKVIEADAFRDCAALTEVVGDCDLESCEAAFIGTSFARRDEESEFRLVLVGSCVVGYKGDIPKCVYAPGEDQEEEYVDELVIPDGVTSIAACAFCPDVYIPKVFSMPPLRYDVDIPSKRGAGRLVLPKGLRYIGEKAFLHCGWMKEVTGGSDVSFVGDAAFYGTMYAGTGFDDWTLFRYEGIETYETFRQVVLGSVLVAVKGPWPSTVVIADGVRRISSNVFYCGAGIVDGEYKREAGRPYWRGYNKTDGIPDRPYTKRFKYDDKGESLVEQPGFDTSTWMTSLTLPSSLERLDEDAFTPQAVEHLTSLAGGENVHGVTKYPFAQTPLHESLKTTGGFLRLGDTICGWAGKAPETLTIPEGVAVIADGAFYSSLYYDGGAVTIRRVVLPSTLKRIGKSAFQGQQVLESPAIPHGVEFVGGRAFASCTNMSELTLPSTVKAIGYGIVCCFTKETSVANVTFLGNAPELVHDDEDNVTGGNPLSVLLSSKPHVVSVKENTTGWLVDGDDTVPDEWYQWQVRIIDDWCFEDGWHTDEWGESHWRARVVSATEVKPVMSIPSTSTADLIVDSIGPRVFGAQAVNVVELTIPASIRQIDADAFVGCTALKFVFADPSNVEIVRTALEQAGLDLNAIAIVAVAWETWESDYGDGLDVWGIYGVVSGDLVVPASIDGQKVVSVSFSGSDDLAGVTSITVPDSVEVLGSYAFAWLEGLERVTLGSGVRQVEGGAFFGDEALKTIDVSSENATFRSEDGCILSKDGSVLHRCPGGKTTLTLRADFTEIAPDAFDTAWPHVITRVEAGAAQVELIREALKEAYYDDIDDITFVVLEDVGSKVVVTVGGVEYDITDAFDGGELDPKGSVTITVGGQSVTIPVTPVIGDLPGDEQAFSVDAAGVSVSVRTIPGLRYALRRGLTLGVKEWSEVSAVDGDGMVKTIKDSDPPDGQAFYRIDVMSEL